MATSSTVENIKIEVLVNMIPKFDGNKLTFYDFLDNCDLANSLAHNDIKQILLTIIKSKIFGNARALIRNREFDSWEELRSHLVETYSDRRSRAQWQLELSLCKQLQNESVTAYAYRIENCLVRLTNSLDSSLSNTERQANVKLIRDQALTTFLLGLNKDLNMIIKAQKPLTLEDAISMALAEEREQRAKREIDKHHYTTKPTYKPHISHVSPAIDKHHYTTNKSNYKPHISHTSSVNTSNSFGDQPLQRTIINDNVKQCRYCKKLGHTIEECRKRQYNNNKNKFTQQRIVSFKSKNI